MTDLVSISVSVPQDRVADVYSFVAQLLSVDSPSATPRGTQETPPQRAAAGFGRDTVKRNYKGGVSDYWRPFLDVLAASPDEWVDWTHLCDAIGLEPSRASGMLGAAERRCKLTPPYEKSEDSEDYWFRMPASVAGYVREAASEVAND